MPIVKLKECIEECTGVPTHQQRLTIGSTIVEDWDDEDRMMFIGNYPNIHDGSLLYLVQLEGGSRMKVRRRESTQLIKLVRRGPGPAEYYYQTKHFYINSVMVSTILGAGTIHRACSTHGHAYTSDVGSDMSIDINGG